jgi:antitoxin HicB
MIMREKGLTRADLMRALGCQREHVDRLFRLDHNSRLDSIEDAFKALGAPLRFDVPFPHAA